MWTIEQINRLKKYIDGSRYFEVCYKDQKVFGMRLVPPEYHAEYPPDQADFFLEEYDDAPPDDKSVTLADTEPSDFQVYLLMRVNWIDQDPDWSAADPKAWKEAHP